MNFQAFRRWFRSLFLPSNRLFYLAVFRVLTAGILISKILTLWPSLNFLHGADGLFESSDRHSLGFIPLSVAEDHLHLFYAVFACAAGFMLFGIGRRWTIAAVIICVEVHDDLNWLLLDGGDNLLQFSLLYLFFADSFQYLSLSKSARPRQEYAVSHFLTNMAVAAIIAHLCLAYLISGLSKADAEVWNNGTAMYYILLNDRFRGTDTLNEILANSLLFNFIACYTTIIWESTFSFAVFVKKLRVPILLMGVAMHLSIYALMMIQSFQIIYIFHYGFFFTDDEWAGFLAMVRARLGIKSTTRESSAVLTGANQPA